MLVEHYNIPRRWPGFFVREVAPGTGRGPDNLTIKIRSRSTDKTFQTYLVDK